MEIRLLGPVELLSAHGSVPIGSARQRALLALLALHLHRLMTYDALVDGLSGSDPPAEAVKALCVHVSRQRLRRILVEELGITPSVPLRKLFEDCVGSAPAASGLGFVYVGPPSRVGAWASARADARCTTRRGATSPAR